MIQANDYTRSTVAVYLLYQNVKQKSNNEDYLLGMEKMLKSTMQKDFEITCSKLTDKLCTITKGNSLKFKKLVASIEKKYVKMKVVNKTANSKNHPQVNMHTLVTTVKEIDDEMEKLIAYGKQNYYHEVDMFVTNRNDISNKQMLKFIVCIKNNDYQMLKLITEAKKKCYLGMEKFIEMIERNNQLQLSELLVIMKRIDLQLEELIEKAKQKQYYETENVINNTKESNYYDEIKKHFEIIKHVDLEISKFVATIKRGHYHEMEKLVETAEQHNYQEMEEEIFSFKQNYHSEIELLITTTKLSEDIREETLIAINNQDYYLKMEKLLQKIRLSNTCNGMFLNSSYLLPVELISLILSFLDAQTLAFSCRSVCHLWNELIINCSVWTLKMEREPIRSTSSLTRLEKRKLKLRWEAYYSIFKADSFEVNLLKNNCGQDTLQDWIIQSSGRWPSFHRHPSDFAVPEGARGFEEYYVEWWRSGKHTYLSSSAWQVENPPVGAECLPEHKDFANNKSCFATTYEICVKHQTICFADFHITAFIMDFYRPSITVSEWYSGRFDCSSFYGLYVRLLDREKKVIYVMEPIIKIHKPPTTEWTKVSRTIEGYPKGVRYLEFEHRGKDIPWWRGHYGSKMAGGVVKVHLPTKIYSENDTS